MKVTTSGRGFQNVEHDTYPPGAPNDVRLLQESSVSDRLWIGAGHHLDKAEVRKVIKYLENWLETGNFLRIGPALRTTKINDAAKSLHEHLGGHAAQDLKTGWLQSLGLAENGRDKSILVYTLKKRHPKVPKEWQGFKVSVHYVGKVRPAKGK